MFRAWTTGVSNPLCSPRFRASASVVGQRVAFAIGVPHSIYAFHRYSVSSTLLSYTQARQYRKTLLGWAKGFHKRLTEPPRRPLRPVIPDNARILCLTAAAGTELADAYSWSTVIGRAFPPVLILSPEKGFTTRRPSSPTRCRWLRLSSIGQDSPLLPPVGVWAVSQSQCGWPSSQTSYPSKPW